MKQISLKTNINGKMSCKAFVHLSEAPRGSVPESSLGKVYELVTEDQSHPPIRVKLLHFYRFPLIRALDQDTLPSHGVDAQEFVEKFMHENNITDISFPMAAYYYQVVDESEEILCPDLFTSELKNTPL